MITNSTSDFVDTVASACHKHEMLSVSLGNIGLPVSFINSQVDLTGFDLHISKKKEKLSEEEDEEDEEEEEEKSSQEIYLFQKSSLGDVYSQKLSLVSPHNIKPVNVKKSSSSSSSSHVENSTNNEFQTFKLNSKAPRQNYLPVGVVCKPLHQKIKYNRDVLTAADASSNKMYPLNSNNILQGVDEENLRKFDILKLNPSDLKFPIEKIYKKKWKNRKSINSIDKSFVDKLLTDLIPSLKTELYDQLYPDKTAIQNPDKSNDNYLYRNGFTLWEIWKFIIDNWIKTTNEFCHLSVDMLRQSILSSKIFDEHLICDPVTFKSNPTNFDGIKVEDASTDYPDDICKNSCDCLFNANEKSLCGKVGCLSPHLLKYSFKIREDPNNYTSQSTTLNYAVSDIDSDLINDLELMWDENI